MRTAIAVALTGLAAAGASEAYEPETHRELGIRAAVVSSLDRRLKEDLQMPDGLRTALGRRTAAEWVGEGAAREDSPHPRVLNHFHDPLRPWDSAGLRVVAPLGLASPRWQQAPGQHERGGGGSWSWNDARAHYLRALTAESSAERARALAAALRGVGQLTHTIQDAASPAHTRNDPHLVHDGLEHWVEAIRLGARGPDGQDGPALFAALLLQAPVWPEPDLATPTHDALAPLAIARLIDGDLFDGADAGVLESPRLGLAEYTSGNFVSDDTIFIGYALPRPEGLAPAPVPRPEGPGVRYYFSKTRDGARVEHFVAAGAFLERLRFRGRPERADVLDHRVYHDYAALLVPRAVGYSAALIDHFFRGRLDVDLVPEPGEPEVVRVRGWNASTEALAGGDLRLYADDAGGGRRPAAALDPTAVAGIPPGGEVVSARFRLPAGGAERFVAVYVGALGAEPGPEGARP